MFILETVTKGNNMDTHYASAKRSSNTTLQKQKELFQDNKLINEITNAVSVALVILNKNRQIVFMNNIFSQLSNHKTIDDAIGLRPGEALDCIYANTTEGGCGTTEFCRKCGAVNSILKSQKGLKNVSECLISVKNNEAYDLEVSSSPFELDGESYTIFTIKDITDQNRRNMLERLFFHDVLNSAGGISGLSEILSETDDIIEFNNIAKLIHHNADNLIDEITSQRQLLAAEKGELQINATTFSSKAMLEQIYELYSKHQITSNKIITISNDSEDFKIETDSTLLRRVIGNMTKNAIEASLPDTKITLKSGFSQNKPIFSVHNEAYIPIDIQLQIFKRSFSTKGSGRGIGAYSMKLFGEKYLNGKVWFDSNKKEGTTFYIELPVSI